MHWFSEVKTCGVSGWFSNISWLMPIIIFTSWMILAYIVYKLITSIINKNGSNNAITILENRLANCEISIEEYNKIRNTLKK